MEQRSLIPVATRIFRHKDNAPAIWGNRYFVYGGKSERKAAYAFQVEIDRCPTFKIKYSQLQVIMLAINRK